jgi:hypothetical protein
VYLKTRESEERREKCARVDARRESRGHVNHRAVNRLARRGGVLRTREEAARERGRRLEVDHVRLAHREVASEGSNRGLTADLLGHRHLVHHHPDVRDRLRFHLGEEGDGMERENERAMQEEGKIRTSKETEVKLMPGNE